MNRPATNHSKFWLIGCLIFVLNACTNTSAPTATPPTASSSARVCPEQRPQVCTLDFRPVCATRDTGVRCVTAPCPSSEQKTYANGCSACADSKVLSYTQGACPEPEND